jgi:hypothetical protein
MTHIPCLGIMDLAWGTADGSFPDTAGHDKPPPPPDEYGTLIKLEVLCFLKVARVNDIESDEV